MLDTPNAANSGPFCISNKGTMMQDDERYETDMHEVANMLKLPVSLPRENKTTSDRKRVGHKWSICT